MPRGFKQPLDNWHTPRPPQGFCREFGVRKVGLLLGFWLVSTGLWADPPAPAPTPAQKELQQPLSLDDGKPTSQAPAPEPSGWRTVGSMLLVGGLAMGSLWALKKWGQGRLPGTGGGKLRMEETLALGERRFVSILRCEDERYLLALTPQGITLLSKLDGIPGTAAPDFGEALDEQLNLPHPLPVRDAEALLKGNRG